MTNLTKPLKLFLWAVLFAEAFGSIYGYYWYKEQLLATPWYWWLFTWDCPFYSSLFSIWLYSYLKKGRLHQNPLFTSITFTGLIKYGMWTVLIVQDSYFWGSPVTIDRLGLQVSHFIMLIQGFILLRSIKFRYIAAVFVWMILNDFMDYYMGTYPWIRDEQVRTAMWLALSSTIVLTGWLIATRCKELWRSRLGSNRASL
jgi:uncharacterized membrane protein YpjA